MNRREALLGLGSAALAAGSARAVEKPLWMSPQLPDGTREEATLEALPGKQKLIRLSDRPPNYETPIGAFRTAITPNDEFFVRYHLATIPPMAELGKWSLAVGGDAAELVLDRLVARLHRPERAEIAALHGGKNQATDMRPDLGDLIGGYADELRRHPGASIASGSAPIARRKLIVVASSA